MAILDTNILYPIFENINDNPEPPNALKPGNGADLIERYNNLVRAIAPRIELDLSNAETDLGVKPDDVAFLMLPVPFGAYLADPNNTSWAFGWDREDLSFADLSDVVVTRTNFNSLVNVFTFAFTGGGGYGGGSPIDNVYLDAMEATGNAAFIDLPTVYDDNSGNTWNNLVGVVPMDSSLKIKLRPTLTKPATGEPVNTSSFQPQ